MRRVVHIRRRPESGPLVLFVRWGLPLMFVIFGIVLIVLAHGHLGGVQDNAAESNVFTSTLTDRDSVLSAAGVASIVVALMIMLLSWMLRMNADESGDRAEEDQAREYFRQHGRWPGDE